MKFTLSLVALALQLTGAIAARSAAEIADLQVECGVLGVQDVPEGADPAKYRHCAGHPLGEDRLAYVQQSDAPTEKAVKKDHVQMKAANIFARSCYYGSEFGCSGGYCWKQCTDNGDGQWCWTAEGDGGGPWRTCSSWEGCKDKAACGKGCKGKDKSCGCSC